MANRSSFDKYLPVLLTDTLEEFADSDNDFRTLLYRDAILDLFDGD